MDDRFKAILDTLPEKRQRSKLEPYGDLIDALRRRGHTFREIAHILAEKCALIVVSTTVVRFVASRSKSKRRYSKCAEREYELKNRNHRVKIQGIIVNPASAGPVDETRKRIESLKQLPSEPPEPPKPFDYDPDKPLHLIPKPGVNRPGGST